VDGELWHSVGQAPKKPVTVLDIACGTGIYIDFQWQFFPLTYVIWHGIDEAPDMLAKAQSKVVNATDETKTTQWTNVIFQVGMVEALPFAVRVWIISTVPLPFTILPRRPPPSKKWPAC